MGELEEVYVAAAHRQMGVATWLIHAVAEGKHVELQVRSGAAGEGARKAYQKMGMRTRPKRAKGVVYERASDGYELMYIEKWVVRSNWIHTCKIRRYDNGLLA